MDNHGKEFQVNGFERIKNIHLRIEPFSIENDILTPKMSLKRHIAKHVHEKELKELYDEQIDT
jgi:long-chain acyl-CoA synthetase